MLYNNREGETGMIACRYAWTWC